MSNDKLFIECKYFNNGDTIPIDYTGRGKGLSPEFILHNLPPETQTIAIIMEILRPYTWDFKSLGYMEYTCARNHSGRYRYWKYFPRLG